MPGGQGSGNDVPAAARRKGGRPPKFPEPCRPVTVTLPESTLSQLAGIDQDRAQAIAKAAAHYGGWSPAESPVAFVPMSPESGLLLLKPCQALHGIPGLNLVEIVPGRFLVLLAQGTPVGNLELALGDLLGSAAPLSGGDREVVVDLLAYLARSRRSLTITACEVVLVPPGEKT